MFNSLYMLIVTNKFYMTIYDITLAVLLSGQLNTHI